MPLDLKSLVSKHTTAENHDSGLYPSSVGVDEILSGNNESKTKQVLNQLAELARSDDPAQRDKARDGYRKIYDAYLDSGIAARSGTIYQKKDKREQSLRLIIKTVQRKIITLLKPPGASTYVSRQEEKNIINTKLPKISDFEIWLAFNTPWGIDRRNKPKRDFGKAEDIRRSFTNLVVGQERFRKSEVEVPDGSGQRNRRFVEFLAPERIHGILEPEVPPFAFEDSLTKSEIFENEIHNARTVPTDALPTSINQTSDDIERGLEESSESQNLSKNENDKLDSPGHLTRKLMILRDQSLGNERIVETTISDKNLSLEDPNDDAVEIWDDEYDDANGRFELDPLKLSRQSPPVEELASELTPPPHMETGEGGTGKNDVDNEQEPGIDKRDPPDPGRYESSNVSSVDEPEAGQPTSPLLSGVTESEVDTEDLRGVNGVEVDQRDVEPMGTVTMESTDLPLATPETLQLQQTRSPVSHEPTAVPTQSLSGVGDLSVDGGNENRPAPDTDVTPKPSGKKRPWYARFSGFLSAIASAWRTVRSWFS